MTTTKIDPTPTLAPEKKRPEFVPPSSPNLESKSSIQVMEVQEPVLLAAITQIEEPTNNSAARTGRAVRGFGNIMTGGALGRVLKTAEVPEPNNQKSQEKLYRFRVDVAGNRDSITSEPTKVNSAEYGVWYDMTHKISGVDVKYDRANQALDFNYRGDHKQFPISEADLKRGALDPLRKFLDAEYGLAPRKEGPSSAPVAGIPPRAPTAPAAPGPAPKGEQVFNTTEQAQFYRPKDVSPERVESLLLDPVKSAGHDLLDRFFKGTLSKAELAEVGLTEQFSTTLKMDSTKPLSPQLKDRFGVYFDGKVTDPSRSVVIRLLENQTFGISGESYKTTKPVEVKIPSSQLTDVATVKAALKSMVTGLMDQAQ